jgi:hypothetical protein
MRAAHGGTLALAALLAATSVAHADNEEVARQVVHRRHAPLRSGRLSETRVGHSAVDRAALP